MEVSRVDHHIQQFAVELLSAGSMLSGLLRSLVDGLPPDAYPGEEPEAVVLEMLCGTIATALDSVDRRDVRRATELIDLARARVLEHLRLARDLSRRMHGGDGGQGRMYG
jgi:hypothetical protein